MRARAEAGFTLVEVLVALAMAGLFLGAFARALSFARGAARLPFEETAALALADTIAFAEAHHQKQPATGFRDGMAYEIHAAPLILKSRPSDLPPAPETAAKAEPKAEPAAVGPLQKILVVVTAPSGRTVYFEIVRFDASP
jgi:prepilin-type N-terminal cleavage/methylation domain-containing protein